VPVDRDVYCCTTGSFTANADGRLSEIARRYLAEAPLRAVLGPPAGAEGPAAGGGRWQPFHAGLMAWSVLTGAREVHGRIATKYLRLGGTRGRLGRPLSDEVGARAPGTRQSIFQGGRIFWSRATGAYSVTGAILARYLALGDTASTPGPPVSDEYSVPG